MLERGAERSVSGWAVKVVKNCESSAGGDLKQDATSASARGPTIGIHAIEVAVRRLYQPRKRAISVRRPIHVMEDGEGSRWRHFEHDAVAAGSAEACRAIEVSFSSLNERRERRSAACVGCVVKTMKDSKGSSRRNPEHHSIVIYAPVRCSTVKIAIRAQDQRSGWVRAVRVIKLVNWRESAYGSDLVNRAGATTTAG